MSVLVVYKGLEFSTALIWHNRVAIPS